MNWKYILLILVSVILTVIIIWRITSGGDKANATQAGPPPPMGVDFVVLKPGSSQSEISVPGTVIASEEVAINPEVSGIVRSIAFNEGERVSAGQLLVTIEQPELSADLQKAEEEINLARTEAERRKKLLDLGGISKAQYEQAYTQYQTLLASRQRISSLMAKGQVRAPFAGVAGLRNVSPGSYISPQEVITTLTKMDVLKIEFKVPERYVHAISDGKKVGLLTDEGIELNAEIYAAESGIDPATRTMTVRATTQAKLVPGKFVEVKLPVATGTTGFAIPTEALIPEIDGEKVFVLEQGKAIKKKVKTGRRGPYEIELTGGVGEGDTIIISGLLVLRDGTSVMPKGTAK